LTCLSPWADAALAQSVAQPDTFKGDITRFHGDQNALVNAIGTIEQFSGVKVVDIRCSDAHGNPGFHAVIVRNGRIAFFHVQQASKKVIEIDASSGPVWMLGWRSRADVNFAEHAPVPLASAIRTAEQSQNGAPAMAAGIARSASNMQSAVQAYTVLLVVDGRVTSVSVDISSGQVISDPSALSM
jgi:hypothetical protein